MAPTWRTGAALAAVASACDHDVFRADPAGGDPAARERSAVLLDGGRPGLDPAASADGAAGAARLDGALGDGAARRADAGRDYRCACGDGGEGDVLAAAGTTIAGGLHQVASLHIPAGAVVRVTGEEPLRIVSRDPVSIEGVLDLSGGNGGPGLCETDKVPVPGAPGGGGGGGAGGAGGARLRAAESGGGAGGGAAAPFNPPAGTHGDFAGGGGGGGGGAAAGADGADGESCPARGVCTPGECLGGAGGPANDALELRGGGGGGGGAYGRADNGMGGAGGGGGGAVLIVAPRIDVAGAIWSDGGRGGDAGMQDQTGAAAECDGGAGGGGAGGAIVLRADVVRVTGLLSARGGAGGVTEVGATCAVGGAGGLGSDGILRIEADDFAGETDAMRAPAACEGTPECG